MNRPHLLGLVVILGAAIALALVVYQALDALDAVATAVKGLTP